MTLSEILGMKWPPCADVGEADGHDGSRQLGCGVMPGPACCSFKDFQLSGSSFERLVASSSCERLATHRAGNRWPCYVLTRERVLTK